jgi:hypothetical protein
MIADVGMSCVAEPSDSFRALVERLSEASVRRRWEAYRDIEWDAPENEVHRDDPRWELRASWDPLAASAWYRDQLPERRSAIGLFREALLLKASIEFETVLIEGLLRLAAALPNGHPAFRYVYHEITEEAQHSMMFQELVNRSGFDPPPAAPGAEDLFRKIASSADVDPILFFVAVLSGEEVTDHLQRLSLHEPLMHPLAQQIGRIHIVEEARHVSFARSFLREAVPRLTDRQLRSLRYQVPFLLAWTVSHLLDNVRVLVPPGVPDDVLQDVTTSEQADAVRRGSLAKLVALCDELDLVDHRVESVWSRLR